jgi:hypothetical protein
MKDKIQLFQKQASADIGQLKMLLSDDKVGTRNGKMIGEEIK